MLTCFFRFQTAAHSGETTSATFFVTMYLKLNCSGETTYYNVNEYTVYDYNFVLTPAH